MLHEIETDWPNRRAYFHLMQEVPLSNDRNMQNYLLIYNLEAGQQQDKILLDFSQFPSRDTDTISQGRMSSLSTYYIDLQRHELHYHLHLADTSGHQESYLKTYNYQARQFTKITPLQEPLPPAPGRESTIEYFKNISGRQVEKYQIEVQAVEDSSGRNRHQFSITDDQGKLIESRDYSNRPRVRYDWSHDKKMLAVWINGDEEASGQANSSVLCFYSFEPYAKSCPSAIDTEDHRVFFGFVK